MIITEYYLTRDDGVRLYRTYSADGNYIERDGVRYEEAVDPEGTDRIYAETDEQILHDGEELDEPETPDEAAVEYASQ